MYQKVSGLSNGHALSHVIKKVQLELAIFRSKHLNVSCSCFANLPRNRPAMMLTNPAATVILAFVDSADSVLSMLRPIVPIIRPTRKNKIPAQVKIRPASNKSGRPENHCSNYASK